MTLEPLAAIVAVGSLAVSILAALAAFRFRDPLTGKWVRARHKLQAPRFSDATPSGS